MRRTILVSAWMLCCFTMQAPAQQSRSSLLVLRVGPETRLVPEQVSVRFLIPADNQADVVNQTASVEAWVRALPGQQIRVTAVLTDLQGPDGFVPVSAVQWSGSSSSASGGGLSANCSSGSFTSGKAQDLVLNWQESGTISCNLTFAFTGALARSPGVYTGLVTLFVKTN